MRHYRDIFSVFFDMKIYRVFSLQSPHRDDSNEYSVLHTIYHFQYKNNFPLNYPIIPNLQLWDCFQRTQEQVRNRTEHNFIFKSILGPYADGIGEKYE